MLKKIFFLIVGLQASLLYLRAGQLEVKERLDLVDPFIGTDQSDVYTKWGKEGGTYPGAVAPWGYIQLTPETGEEGAQGYRYTDTLMRYFSCIKHHSGFPNGSQGNIRVMPVSRSGMLTRAFRHDHEQAKPGYYSVAFQDDGTLVEATSTARVGVFQITFPAGVPPRLWLSDIGTMLSHSKNGVYGSEHGSVFYFNQELLRVETSQGGYMLHFEAHKSAPTVLTILLSASSLGTESSARNINALKKEGKKAHTEMFSYVYKQTTEKWQECMKAIHIEDPSLKNKRIFYTALYHACLLPWVISDVDGFYKGADGLRHQAKGRPAYGGFSPWDTFRSLHPLITLLWPQRQDDMVQSMLDIYQQVGTLPTESMTGNHAVPILVDTYRKNPGTLTAQQVYAALKGSVFQGTFRQKDLAIAHQRGFVPANYSESVTRTLEYAYDDWALSVFAAQVMKDTSVARITERYSRAYHSLFNVEELLFIPKGDKGWKKQSETFGYKEGDASIYSYFVPQYPVELVYLMGGDTLFVNMLQERLHHQQIVFDNEPAFHIPYLFNYAGRRDLTQEWVYQLVNARFSDTPGGLPGNDDLGSMSSWYIFSALGFYPMAPGKPVYTFGGPQFNKVVIQLAGGKQLTILKESAAQGHYIRSVHFNGQSHSAFEIDHEALLQGGTLSFTMTNETFGNWNKGARPLEGSSERPNVELLDMTITQKEVHPNEQIAVLIRLRNTGASSTKQVVLKVDGKPYAYKNVWIGKGSESVDSLFLRLYPYGKQEISIENRAIVVAVTPHQLQGLTPIAVEELTYRPLLKVGETQRLSYRVKNVSGVAQAVRLPILINNEKVGVDSLHLLPGEEQQRTWSMQEYQQEEKNGWVGDCSFTYKVYEQAEESLLLGGEIQETNNQGELMDRTPFANRAFQEGVSFSSESQVFNLDSGRYVRWAESEVLNNLGTRITLMVWLKPKHGSENLVDVLSKGDQHVLQLVNGKKVNFFVGGWGRGECAADLPANWYDQWHHLAGVCDGNKLYVYIDGVLKASEPIEPDISLINNSQWQLGQNEEFPGERQYRGLAKDVMVFADSLSAEEIKRIAEKRQ